MEITATGTSQPSQQAQAASAGALDGLGQDAFLKLLVAQLRNQDPLSPVKDNEFMLQMAQFRIIEQLDKLNQTMAYQAGVHSLVQASSLIGKEVTALTGDDGTQVTGSVSKVELRDGEIVLTVNGQPVYLSEVIQLGG